ncbi:MAG: TonB-dependent receptor [Rhodothermales bacterium]
MITRCPVLLICGLLLLGEVAWAQVNEPAEKDSLLSYDLAEIVIESGAIAREVSAGTVQRVSLAGIARSDAASVDRIARLIPAAHVQTNSRGETLVYLRSAGERQVALFFDGALLNVPWDNRFDLALVPAGVLGGMTIAKGVPSVLYGTNVLGGAINLTSRALEASGTYTEAMGMVGSPGSTQAQLTHLGRSDRWGYILSVGYTDTDGFSLPRKAGLLFNQRDDDRRTNTDRQLLNLFGQANYHFGGGARLGISVLRFDGEKGIAPEGHLDPEQFRVRYWRYPVWRTSMAILNGEVPLGNRGTLLRGAVWGSRFAQTIDQYASERYDVVLEEQEDSDDTFGTRLTLLQPAGPGDFRFALNALTSRHRQQNIALDDGVSGLPLDPPLTFRQHMWSVGAEYGWRPTQPLELVLGASLDGIATPDTGDKPARDPQVDFGITSGAIYSLDEQWTLRASAGRKVRFPTMRELFGEALGRFLINPDLEPESSLLAEAGIGVQSAQVSGELIAFVNRTFDTIERRSVRVPGEDRPRRQRVNLEGSRVYGLEVAGAAQPLRGWSVEGHVTWTHARILEDGKTRHVVEKPEWLGTLTLTHNAPGGFSALLQTVFTGRAYGLDENNIEQALPTSLVIHARAAYRLVMQRLSTEIFARVNNVTDEVTLPQLGLPGPGREFRIGLDVAF